MKQTLPLDHPFEADTEENQMMTAFQILGQVADSCLYAPNEEVQQKTAKFIDLMTNLTVKDEPKIPTNQSIKSLKMDEMNKDFLALFLIRLKSFLINNSDVELLGNIIPQAKSAISTLSRQEDAERYEIILSQLINFSRVLVQDKETIHTTKKFLVCFPKKYSLTNEQNELFKAAFSLFQELLKTPLVKWALNEVLKHPGYKEITEFKVDKIVEILTNIKITWVKGAFYYGMVGLNGVFLDEEIFRLTKPKWTVPKIIGECFREGFNYGERVLSHNFAAMTPISQDSDHLEGGYLFEKYLWGDFNIVYWTEELSASVLDIKHWQKETSLFAEDERIKTNKRNVRFPICSGLCTESKGKDEM